jgi:glycine dehydrogenase subunit 1
MSYVSVNGTDLRTILETIGLERPEDVFSPIPEALVLSSSLQLGGPLDEETLRRELAFPAPGPLFAGGGVYRHHIPAVVDSLASRQEFLTAYTPYQPELSQGTLQAIFEYQSMMASLTGMDVSNASLYDGATALAEAALMGLRVKGISRIAVTRSTHPAYRQVLKTYLSHAVGVEIMEVPYDPATGMTDLAALEGLLGKETAFFVQSPNYFGIIEPMEELAALASARAGFWGIGGHRGLTRAC